MSFDSFVSREFKFGEAKALNYIDAEIAAGEAALEPLVAADAPAVAADLVSAVKAAILKVFGPINGSLLDAGISVDASGIEAELAPLLEKGAAAVEGYVATFRAGIQNRANALQAEALATK